MRPTFGREYIEDVFQRIRNRLLAPLMSYQRLTGFVEMATQSVLWSSPVTTTGREGGRLVGERGPV